MTHANSCMKTGAYINLSNKEKYTRLCQGDTIGAGILVAIMGLPEMNEIIKIVYQLSCLVFFSFFKKLPIVVCPSIRLSVAWENNFFSQ